MSGEPVFEDIETFCPARRSQVVVSLRCAERVRGDVVSGAPVSCNCEAGCSKGAKCLLKATENMSTRRKRK